MRVAGKKLKRCIVGPCLIFLCVALTGCEHTSRSRHVHGARHTLLHSNVRRNDALFAAKAIQAKDPKRMVGWGKGSSMSPIYSENTLLVTAPVKYDELEVDMIVAYKNSKGKNVVHRLVRRSGEYWVAQGINNENADEELVTPENLIGVVYATFQSRTPLDDLGDN